MIGAATWKPKISEIQVGRVVSVDNFRLFIRLNDELTSSYKSGFKGLYEVARINSYLIIPVGDRPNCCFDNTH